MSAINDPGGPVLHTIGYQDATQAQVIAQLAEAGIAVLVDVRAVASSRRAGFSKTVLRESLAEAGIGYRHLRALGTPKAGRDAARAGRTDEMRSIYARQLATPEAVDELAALEALARERPVAILCFCAGAPGCHRRVIAERLATRGLPWRDL